MFYDLSFKCCHLILCLRLIEPYLPDIPLPWQWHTLRYEPLITKNKASMWFQIPETFQPYATSSQTEAILSSTCNADQNSYYKHVEATDLFCTNEQFASSNIFLNRIRTISSGPGHSFFPKCLDFLESKNFGAVGFEKTPKLAAMFRTFSIGSK